MECKKSKLKYLSLIISQALLKPFCKWKYLGFNKKLSDSNFKKNKKLSLITTPTAKKTPNSTRNQWRKSCAFPADSINCKNDSADPDYFFNQIKKSLKKKAEEVPFIKITKSSRAYGEKEIIVSPKHSETTHKRTKSDANCELAVVSLSIINSSQSDILLA